MDEIIRELEKKYEKRINVVYEYNSKKYVLFYSDTPFDPMVIIINSDNKEKFASRSDSEVSEALSEGKEIYKGFDPDDENDVES